MIRYALARFTQRAAGQGQEDVVHGTVADLYVEGVANGEFIDVDPHIATSTLLGASIWSYRWFDPEGELSIDEIAEGIARILLEGYRV